MKTSSKILMISLMLVGIEIYPQYPNFRIYPSSAVQIEPVIVRHPTNQQILFASAYTISPPSFRSEGIYVSTDGGNSWRGNDTNTGSNLNFHGGDPGPVIDKNGVFIITHLPPSATGMLSNFSTDQGLTWSVNNLIYNATFVDKAFTATDDAPSSPFYGRSYVAFTRFSPPYPLVYSFTTNGGTNWSTVSQLNSSCNGNRSYGPSISVGPTGVVFIAWASSITISPYSEDYIGFAKSSNGGINWNVNECAIDCNGIRATQLPPWGIRSNSNPTLDVDKTGGPRNGWIYVAIANKNLPPAGSDPDIVFHRSTDNGNTWSSGVRVNQDQINNGRNQFFPIIRADENGGINIIYYDSRHAADSVDVYLSRSTDGGTSWNDFRVTSNRFMPKSPVGSSGNMGDNLGLTSGNGFLYPAWMSDQVTERQFQIWYAKINYTTIGIKQISTEIPGSFALMQNYPNPFNPVTHIQFEIPEEKSNVSLIVYDINGKEIETLVNQQMKPGTYEAAFDAAQLGSGVYFYILRTDSFFESKKMILVK